MFETIVEGLEGFGGWALAIGAVVIAGPTVGRVLRPAAKSAIKGYFTLAEGARTAANRAQQVAQGTKETVQDLVAEARNEQQTEPKTTSDVVIVP